MSTRKPRARTERRAADRAAQADVRARERIARLEPGGAREWPIVVPSAVVIEGRAAATLCGHCAGPLKVIDHDLAVIDDARRRQVRARCQRCSRDRTLWFEIVAPAEN
ncbi:MAG: hypothetical protein IPL61_33810 [Myxococcales bacterium]|nr:hypothetical protein [Myxococcales bacterium]